MLTVGAIRQAAQTVSVGHAEEKLRSMSAMIAKTKPRSWSGPDFNLQG
jgi:hypothetical protein